MKHWDDLIPHIGNIRARVVAYYLGEIEIDKIAKYTRKWREILVYYALPETPLWDFAFNKVLEDNTFNEDYFLYHIWFYRYCKNKYANDYVIENILEELQKCFDKKERFKLLFKRGTSVQDKYTYVPKDDLLQGIKNLICDWNGGYASSLKDLADNFEKL